jgi:tetratricopeptide (TPR) repeat protein
MKACHQYAASPPATIVLLVLGFLCTGIAPAADRPRACEDAYKEGIDAFIRRDLDQAISCLNEVIKKGEEAEKALEEARKKGEKMDTALRKKHEELSLCVKEDSDLILIYGTVFYSYLPYYYRGVALFESNRHKEALADFNKTIDEGAMNDIRYCQEIPRADITEEYTPEEYIRLIGQQSGD